MKHLRKSWNKTPKVIVPLLLAAVMAVALLATAISAVGAAAEDDPDAVEHGPGSTQTYQYTMEAGSYEIVDTGDGYQEIRMEGFGQLLTSGKPKLPSKIFFIAIPPGVRVDSVEVIGTGLTERGTYSIAPAPMVSSLNATLEEIEEASGEYDKIVEEAYSSDQPYPAAAGEFVGQGMYRKYNLAQVRYSPFYYKAKSGELYLYPTMQVNITYSYSDAISAEADMMMEDYVPEAEERAAEIIINYEDAQQWYPAPAESHTAPYPTPQVGSGYSDSDAQQSYAAPIDGSIATTGGFVIITTDALEDSVWPIRKWETCKGRAVYVETVEDIAASYTGVDLADEIRQFLRDYLAPLSITKVLLVGDITDVPMRYTYPNGPDGPDDDTTPYELEDRVPTDYYYAELSLPDGTSWDSNGDTMYGQEGVDNVQFPNEVDVGRIPWSDPGTVEDICTKMVEFEYSTDMSYKLNYLLTGAFFWSDTDNAVLKTYILNNELTPATPPDRIYEQDPNCWDSAYYSEYAMSRIITRTVWGGGHYGFVNLAGHGSHSGVYYKERHDTCSPELYFHANDCSYLNDDYPSIVFSCACSSAWPEDNNLGKMLLERGAISFVGSTRVAFGAGGWDDPSDGNSATLDWLFAHYAVSYNFPRSSVGYSHQAALQSMYSLYNWDTSWWQFFEWNIYSNPDLWLRDRPASLPNLTDTTPSGWSYPIVPRSAGDATDTWCPITTTLPGNTLGTYYNWSWTNDGSYNAPAHRTHLYLDGVYSWWSTIGLMNPGYEVKFINQGPNTVRGGRHTLYYDIDVNEEVWETSEADNRWSRQFVWSPYELSDDTSVTRSAPPKKDAWGGAMPRWYNNDGFSFYVHNDHPNKYWSAVGILPGNSASDYSLRLWDIGDYTGSEQGFGVGYLEWSTYGTDVSEFVIVNDNQAAHGTYFAGAINDNEGTANFRIEEATSTKIWPRPGTEWNGPYSPASDNVLDIYECGLGAGEYYFYLDQTSGTCDLGMTLYDDETTHCKKGEHMVGGYADSYGDGADESFTVSIPDSGYHGLAVWKTDSSDYSKSSTYRIYFVRRCDLTIAVDGTGNTNPAPGTYTYDYDTEVTITAIETDPCWEFDHFMVDSTQYNYSPITITITADTNVTAYFTRKPYDLTIGVSGNGTTDPIPGTHIYDCCTWASITAIENDTCWEFDHWSGDASGNSSTVRVHIDGDKSVTANFVYKGSFNLTIGVSGTGTTDPPPGTHTYDCCTMVDVEAIETDPLWQFDHWSGDASGTSPTVKVHIDENKSVTAHFIAKPDLVIEQKWEVEAAPKKYLHPAETPLDPLEPIEKPICPDWHELYPAYCNQYQLSDWEDNGDGVLSPCDNIVLTDKTTGEEVLHHVDEMTVTILVSSEQPEIGEEVPVLQAVEEAYLEFVGGYEEVARAMKEPVCTYWHLVYPEFCPDYHIAGWDDNGDGYLNYCDYILLDDVETGKGWWWHVEEVTWDIIVSPVEPVSPCTYVVWYTVLNQGSDTAEAGHSVTLYVDKKVIEHKVVPVDLEPKGNYTDSFRTVVECTPPGDLIEVCADNYEQVDELDEKNNCLDNEWLCPPSIDVEKKVWDPETGEWVEEVCALLDDIVRFQCTIHNDGCCDLTKILVTDILSESLRYANNATVNGEPWEPTIVEPNEFEWKLEDWLLEPCNTIEIEFDATVVMWSAEPDVNTQMADAWCDEAGIMVDDQDTAAVQPFCPGDADMDGDVDVFDWVRVRRILMGLDPPTCGADADMDGDIDVFDWVRVRRILMGLEPYPC